ncbi:hypothetical protein G7062_00035 [Erysipelothrix sp. HDW6C]|uniref:hypothetical protein n=1 Tax=Erysipelothrix sp. HDW6C TaxID=2714930 RepID=UPI00140DE7A3|nr:hypothetical protein [Erysipelothrix sp. HDW6C]QIK68764.1 hypothetical protein G7062_00035 [Erysipelothrix sp. HDW6C]
MTEFLGTDRERTIHTLDNNDDVTFANKSDNRFARKIISKLRPKKRYFIPVGRYRYKLFHLCTEEEQESFLKLQVQQMNSQYFDTVKPLMDLIGEERIKKLYDGGFFKHDE